MSSIITAILSSTVGLLCDKARDSGADKLKDGDLTDETMRKMIVKDLTDIKTKLDCLLLKDLKASYSFLKEGVELLNLTLDQSTEDQKASEVSADEATRVINCTASGVLNAALSLPHEIQRLKISSDKRFVSVQDRFKASRERATDAFNNESLSIKDRIMACKLRVAATIIELGLEDPEAAITACLLSLEELHGLPAMQEMFAVFFKRGLKSKLNKSERLENMMSVLFISRALYDFATKYSCSKSCFPSLAFPGIKLKARLFHPILNADEVMKKTSIGGESFQKLKQVHTGSSKSSFAVNSRGDIILQHDDKITVIYSSGENKDVMFPDTTEKNVLGIGLSVAVDSNDSVYAIRLRKVRYENGGTKYDFMMYIFDENFNIKTVGVCVFFFLPQEWSRVYIAVDKNENLIMITNWNNQLYVCDKTGMLKFEFKRDGENLRSLSISNNNDIMIVSHDHRAIHTYSTDGDLKSTIKVPDGHKALRVAFHHSICKIIALTHVGKEDSLFLFSYSETGELENSVFFCKDDPEVDSWKIELKSHPSGPVAVLYCRSITFL